MNELPKSHPLDPILLKELNLSDAEHYYDLYNNPQIREALDSQVFQNEENSLQFTERIMNACQFIWTIRDTEDQSIIGDCALHQYNATELEVYFGGVLLPEYWGKGYMGLAFEHARLIAKEYLNVQCIKASTTPNNGKAIRFALKIGFIELYRNEKEVCLAYKF